MSKGKDGSTEATTSVELVVAGSSETGVTPVHTNRGFENVAVETVTMPIAKLLQPISKELTDEGFADYNFKAGNIIHSILLEKLPETFIPLIMNDNKICFVPKQDAGKAALKAKRPELTDDDFKGSFVCRSEDNITGTRFGSCQACGLAEFDGNEAPFCTKNINVLSVFEGEDLPVVIRFANTSHKHGRAFKNLAYFSRGDLFTRKYKLLPLKKTDKGNTWFELTVKPAGKTSDAEFAMAEDMYSMFKNMMIEVNDPDEHVSAEPVVVAEF